jgi:hypothetical protein
MKCRGEDKGGRGARGSGAILNLLSLALLFTALGCSAAGVAAHKVLGPPAVPAMYVPQQQPLVVLVEDYHRATALTDDELLSRYVEEEFRRNVEKVPVVDSAKVREVRLSKPDAFKKMSVADVGREVGAQQVVWVDVTERTIESLLGGESLRGAVAVRVKVVDVKTGQTLWPLDMSEGYPLSTGTSWGTKNPSSEAELKNALYRGLADKVAKLFYKWKPEEEEPEGFTE